MPRPNLAHLRHRQALHSGGSACHAESAATAWRARFQLDNRVHVPIAHYSLLFLVVLLAAALARRRFDTQAQLAAMVVAAIVANAFACGVLSGPHDRYGARIAWLATLSIGIAILVKIKSSGMRRNVRSESAAGP